MPPIRFHLPFAALGDDAGYLQLRLQVQKMPAQGFGHFGLASQGDAPGMAVQLSMHSMNCAQQSACPDSTINLSIPSPAGRIAAAVPEGPVSTRSIRKSGAVFLRLELVHLP